MIDTVEYTAYICNKNICAIHTDTKPIEHSGPDSLEYSEGEAEIPIIQNGISASALFAEIGLQPSNRNIPELCLTNDDLSYVLYYDTLLNRTDSVRITIDMPYTCGIQYGSVYGEHYGFLFTKLVASGGGSVNDTPILDTGTPYSNDSSVLVPGEKIHLKWKFARYSVAYKAAEDYIHTCALTGGWVTGIHGSYGSINITYDVLIEGIEYHNIRPSDFKEYKVGDWVFVLKPGGLGSTCGRGDSCKGDAYSIWEDGPEESPIIIPIAVDSVASGG